MEDKVFEKAKSDTVRKKGFLVLLTIISNRKSNPIKKNLISTKEPLIYLTIFGRTKSNSVSNPEQTINRIVQLRGN